LERHTLASGERASVDEQMIVERIHAAVMRQALRPKTKLSESALCKTFDVGRMKVRRALLLLASQGIVDLQSNRGAFIACPDLKQASEIFEARKLIEPNLIERLSMAIDAGGICVLSDHIDAEKQARQKNERPEIIRLSGELHVAIASVFGNTFLMRTVRELVARTSLIVGLFGDESSTSCREDEHEQILNALKRGDADNASKLTWEHLDHIQKSLDFSHPQNDKPDLITLLRA